MKKIYLVDSENVGDVWVPLLASSQPEDEVLVFYTQKSPHMSYENVRMLKETDREAVFIKCFEGSNALDFQLVSELGFRLSQDSESEYVIVSNDTGFDAAVRYWLVREMPVSRLSGKECYRNLVARKNRAEEKAAMEAGRAEVEGVAAEVSQQTSENDVAVTEASQPEMEDAAVEVSQSEEGETVTSVGQSEAGNAAAEASQSAVEMEVAATECVKAGETPAEAVQTEPVQETEQNAGAIDSAEDVAVTGQTESLDETNPAEDITESVQLSGMDEDMIVKNLFRCISKENLVDFHNALVALLGEEKGKALYQEIKGNAEYTTYWAGLPVSNQREKFDIYCSIVFAHSDFATDVPEDFAGFLYQANGKRKNLNSLRAALQGHYGKDKGMKYYSLFKSHIKIMNRM